MVVEHPKFNAKVKFQTHMACRERFDFHLFFNSSKKAVMKNT